MKQARTWLGTKFQHQGRIKKSYNHKGACDCLGFVIGVAKELNLQDKRGLSIASLDEDGYSMSPNGEYLRGKLRDHLIEKKIANIQSGDLALFSFMKNPRHLAIIGSSEYDTEKYLTLIHAYSGVGEVCEHRLDSKWRKRLVSVFSIIA